MPKVIDLREKGVEINVPIAKLVEDFSLYPRIGLNNTTVATYREAHRAGAKFPRILIDHKWRIIDGWHRKTVFELEGAKTIPAIQVRVRNDVHFFELAAEANAKHGTPYSGYDRNRMIARAEELGITKERISEILSVTVEKIEDVEKGWASVSADQRPMPLKASVRHLAGRKLTAKQFNAHEHIGGMQQTFYVNQVLLFLEGNLLDYQNEA